jgi:hypothetical protein
METSNMLMADVVISMKITKQQYFQTTWTKEGLILNPSYGIKKSKEKIICVHNVNANRFYHKNMTRI